MLTNCPECGKKVSDKAVFCPGCGFPIAERPTKKQAPHKKNGTVLPSRNVRVQIYLGKNSSGKRIYKSFTAPNKTEARIMATEYKATHSLDDIHKETVEKAMEHFFTLKEPVLSPSTIRGYKSLQRNIKANFDWFCKLCIDDLDKMKLQQFINELSESAKPKTVSNYYGFVTSVLSVYDIETPKCTLPKKIKPDLNIPDLATIKRLFEIVKDTEIEIPILLAATGPMRRGEIYGLRLDDIEGDVIHVRRGVAVDENGKVVVKATAKTYESDRYIEFPHWVIEKIRKKGRITNLSINDINENLKRILVREHIKPFRFHDLRHAFVSIAHANGIPDAEIQRRGGWATNNVMNTVYRHSLDDTAKLTLNKLENLFS